MISYVSIQLQSVGFLCLGCGPGCQPTSNPFASALTVKEGGLEEQPLLRCPELRSSSHEHDWDVTKKDAGAPQAPRMLIVVVCLCMFFCMFRCADMFGETLVVSVKCWVFFFGMGRWFLWRLELNGCGIHIYIIIYIYILSYIVIISIMLIHFEA
jgi:hypothetical protein